MVTAQADPATAFLAVHIALALQEAGPRRVLLLDLTVPGGASLVFLDAEQSYHALDALGDVDRCDQTLIDTAFARFRDGLYLLCLPEECVAAPAVEAEQLGRLLDGFTGFFDHVVVVADTGIGLTPLAAVCSRARKTLLLTDQSVLRSRRNKQLLHALRRCDCPLDSLGLVVDHGQAKAGMEAERLAGLLEVPLVGSLDGRLSVRVEAMNAGESLFDHAPRDGYCRDVLALLDTLGSEAVAPGGRGGVMQRWFGT
ncbi:MAG: hypothetical protein L0H83_11825 [Salinisphaera sp.]|nr:hypothetical protein [Salinisphaera sp.]